MSDIIIIGVDTDPEDKNVEAVFFTHDRTIEVSKDQVRIEGIEVYYKPSFYRTPAE
jgi:hypothetical protein